MRTVLSRVTGLLEPVLVRLEEQPSAAIYRIVAGFAFFPLAAAAGGDRLDGATLFGAFAVALMALRLGPAVLRMLLPFSASAKAAWSARRQLAKRYDSYQWQKLFWIGLGLIAYLWLADDTRPAAVALSVTSTACGLAGLAIWRTRVTECAPPPPSPERVEA